MWIISTVNKPKCQKSIQDLDINTFLVYDPEAKLRPFHSIYKPYNNRWQWSVTHVLERGKKVCNAVFKGN